MSGSSLPVSTRPSSRWGSTILGRADPFQHGLRAHVFDRARKSRVHRHGDRRRRAAAWPTGPPGGCSPAGGHSPIQTRPGAPAGPPLTPGSAAGQWRRTKASSSRALAPCCGNMVRWPCTSTSTPRAPVRWPASGSRGKATPSSARAAIATAPKASSPNRAKSCTGTPSRARLHGHIGPCPPSPRWMMLSVSDARADLALGLDQNVHHDVAQDDHGPAGFKHVALFRRGGTVACHGRRSGAWGGIRDGVPEVRGNADQDPRTGTAAKEARYDAAEDHAARRRPRAARNGPTACGTAPSAPPSSPRALGWRMWQSMFATGRIVSLERRAGRGVLVAAIPGAARPQRPDHRPGRAGRRRLRRGRFHSGRRGRVLRDP